jgi:LacI family transcriptional regulator
VTTIKDVARLAKVSITSASYALNGTGTISESTRERVRQAAEQLNYHANPFARNLKKQKSRTIGVFITRFGGLFYEDILEGIHDAILQSEYELIVCPESHTMRRILTQRMVDAAIVFDTKVQDATIIKVASEKYPVVVLDRYLEAEHVFPVLIDNRQGVREAFTHLYQQGARRIFFVSGALDSYDNAERMQAFLEEGQKKQLPIQVYNGNFTEESGYNVARMIIAAHDLPEAVFCANDQMAIGFMKAMKECNLNAPEDISIVGFDDIQLASYVHPTLSTIGASRRIWGSTAINRLIDFLDNDRPFITDRIPTRLIPRESSCKHQPSST